MVTTATAAVPRAKRGALTRRVILDAASVLFNEKGYDRTSLDDIARALSVTKPSLYYHFTSKEDLLLECVDAAYVHFSDEMARRDRPEANGRERMAIFLRLYLEVMTHDVGVSLVIADDRVMSDDGRARYNKLRRRLNDELVARVEQGVADGSLVVEDVRLTSFAVFGMFNWIGHWYFRRKAASLDEIFDAFMRFMLNGIGAREPGA